MKHYYGIIPNGKTETGDEGYMIDWCTEMEGGICRVPTGRLDESINGIFHVLSNGLNMSLQNAIFVAKALAKEEYPIYLYERMSNDPKSDDYWRFKISKEIKYRNLYHLYRRQVYTEFDLMKRYLEILLENKEVTRKDINEFIGITFDTALQLLKETGNYINYVEKG